MKKILPLVGLLGCLLLGGSIAHSQPKGYYKKKLHICERLYEDGRYLKALRYSDDLLEKLRESKNTDDTLAAPMVLMHKAKYLEALARFEEFKAFLNESLALRRAKGEHTLTFAKGLLEAGLLYLEFSDIVTAENYLNAAKKVLSLQGEVKDLWFEASVKKLAAHVAHQEGDYRQASEAMPQLLEVLESRITGEETYFDEPTGQYAQRSLNKVKRKRRARDYARALILRAQIARDRGEYQKADSLFKSNAEWIKANIHRTGIDVVGVENTHEHLKLKLALGQNPKQLRKAMERNLFRAERAVGLVHKAYLNAHELLIQNYTDMRYSSRGKKQIWELKTNTQRYYSEEHLPYAVYKRLEAKRDFYRRSNSILGSIRAVFIDRETILEKAKESLADLHQDIHRVPLNHAEQIEVLQQLYKVSLALNELDSASSYLDQVLDRKAAIFGRHSLTYHISRIDLADFYLRYSTKTKEVRSILDESFHEYLEKELQPQSLEYINALDEYALYYSNIGKFDSASYMIGRAVALMEENVGPHHPLYAEAVEQMVRLDLEQGEFQDASTEIDSMLYIYDGSYGRHSPYSFSYAKALSTAADYYATIGLFDNARRALNRSERYARRSDASRFDPEMQENRMALLIETEKLKQAEELVIEAIEKKKEAFGENSRFLIDPYLFRASIYLIDGDYIGAREMVEKAYELSASIYGERSFKITKALALRAQVLTALGSYEKAIADLEQVIDINSEIFGPDHVQLAKPYMQLGLATFSSNPEKLDKAAELVQKSVDLYSSSLGNDNPAYAEALKTLSQIYIASNKLTEAEKLLLEARGIWIDKLGSELNSNTAEIDLLLGDVLVKKKAYEMAQRQYESARKIYARRFTKQHPGYIRAVGRLGRVHYIQKDYRRALKYTEEALADHYRVIEDFFPAMSEGEKARFWQTIRVDFEFFNTLAVEASKTKQKLIGEMYNNAINTKAILLSNSIKVRNNILSSNNPALIQAYEKWEALKEQLIQELSFSPEQLREEGLDPKQTQRQIDELEKRLSQMSSEFSQNQEATVVSWKEVKDQLKEGEVAVEIIRYRHFTNTFTDSVLYAALVLTPRENRPILIPIEEGNDLETKYMRYYRACIEYQIEDIKSYGHYWRAIDQVLRKGDKVYLSGEGAYNQINLEAVLADNGQYVIDNSNIALVTNTKELYSKRSFERGGAQNSEMPNNKTDEGHRTEVALFGNPAFYKDLKEEELMSYGNREIVQLKGTQREVLQLDSLLRSSTSIEPLVKLNWEATEEVMKKTENPSILHIATHGYFYPDTKTSDLEFTQAQANTGALLRSGILLTHAGDLIANKNIYEFNKKPGILTAYEATSLRLDSTELVVLSACETARTDMQVNDEQVGEGVYGLQRSFLIAGAKAIIMSLFKVDDEATQKFMLYFYKKWKVEGMEKRQAFTEAKKQLREEYPDPKYWGPFIMVGL